MGWWERGVVYEVYPRSFRDTDGDGVGDLRGVAGRLPYGDELGMVDVEVPPSRMVDPDGRDRERSPMPWTGEPDRGFCPDDVEPWLPFGDPALNVAAQEGDPRSMLALHRRLLALRRSRDDLVCGVLRDAPGGAGRAGVPAGRSYGRGAEPRWCAGGGAGLGARAVDDRARRSGGEVASGSLTLRAGEGAVLLQGA